MVRKKSLLVGLIVLLGLLVMSGCSSGSEDASNDSDSVSNDVAAEEEQITLEFWTVNLRKGFEDYFLNLISEYEQANEGVKIDWVDVPGDQINQKIITALQGDDIPDVVNLPDKALHLLPESAVYPINELVDESRLDVYIPGLMESVTSGDKVLEIPWYNAGPRVGLLNKKLYEDAGLDPDNPPETWDEYFENGEIIHSNLDNVYGSNQIPFMERLASIGVKPFNDDKTKAAFNTPEAVELIQKFVDGYQTGALAPGSVSKNVQQLPESLENGMVAQDGLYVASGLNRIESNAPDEFKQMKVFPGIKEEGGYYGVVSQQALMIPRKSKHPEQAADFALFVTSPENQLEFCKLTPIFPSTSETLQQPLFTNIEGDTLQDQARKIMVEEADDMLAITVPENLREFYEDEIRAAIMGEKSVEEALDAAEEYWNSELSSE